MALMKEIFVARKELAEVFTSSAVGKSVTTNGEPSPTGVAYTSRSSASARSLRTPMTMRSGCSVSSTANPSRRNSGFQASSACSPTGASSARRAASRSAEPTGTVDLPTTSAGRFRCGASDSTAESTYDMSHAYSPCFCGVFTQTKWMSPKSAASAQSRVKRSRPVEPSIPATCRRSSASRPGSYIGVSPRSSMAIFSGTTSSPSTSNPSSAMAAACVAPR